MSGAVLSFALGLSTASLQVASPALASHTVIVESPDVTLGMIVDLSRLPPGVRDRVERMQVVSFQGSQSELILSSRRIFERLRASVPVMAGWFPPGDDYAITVQFRPAGTPARGVQGPMSAQACMRVIRPVGAGLIPTIDDFEPAVCGASPTDRSLRYDANMKSVRALRDLQPGEEVAAVPSFALARVRPGQWLHVATASGPVVIQREVQAVQASAAKRDLFVRGSNGVVFPVPAPMATQ